MKTLNKIRNIFLSTGVLLLASVSFIEAQTYDYTVNWSDTTTYKTSCGKVVPAQWSVKNDSCVMTTPYLRVEAVEGCKVSFNFKINQSGNGDPTDKCYVYHQIDSEDWILDTLIIAGGNPALYSINDSVILNYSHYIKFKICMKTDSKTEFWAIKGGDMVVSDGNFAVNNISSWSGMPPAPLEGPPMPVEFIWVKATTDNNHVNVSWSTASETNNNFFTIERSNNGIAFETLATENGAGNSNSILTYHFKDIDPISGINYYRIKHTDYDGKYAYSVIEVVKISPDETGFSVFPNPVKSGANLQVIPLNSVGDYTLAIYSVTGQKFSDYSANESTSVAIDESIPKGIYYIVASMKTEKHIEKIVIQ
jgi:hypothetical protein